MKKLNNKTLGIILAILIVAYGATKLFRPSGDTNLQSTLMQIDTSLVTKIVLFPQKQNHRKLHLIRNGSGWQVVRGSQSVPANSNSVKSLLDALAYVGIKRLVTTHKKDWTDYNMEDSTTTHVQVYANNHKLADFRVSASSTGTGPYAQTTTYARLDSLSTVYQTGGYLSSLVNKDFDAWRNHRFLHLNKKSITRLQFEYPADSGFTATKTDSVWMIGNQQADSSKMASYLDKLQSREMRHFADAFKPRQDPLITLHISAGNPATVKAWYADSSWILQSSQRPGVYFYDRDSSVFKALMVSKKALLPGKK